MQLANLGETRTIAEMERILSGRQLPEGWAGIGDDAAVTTVAGAAAKVLTTVDMLVEDVHFTRSGIAPRDLGWKALAVNVSDIHAMGGVPGWAVVALALRGDLDLTWLQEFYAGLAEASEALATPVVGGDTVGTPGPLAVSVTVVGHADRPRLRSAAQPGDVIAVSGPLGLSAAGLWLLGHPEADVRRESAERARKAHVRPQLPGYGPELAAIERLALMDDSDGLGVSAEQIAKASGVAVILESQHLTPAPDVAAIAGAARLDPLEWMLWGGEDYGLIAALPADAPLPEGFAVVGRVEGGAGAWLQKDGRQIRLERAGFRHF